MKRILISFVTALLMTNDAQSQWIKTNLNGGEPHCFAVTPASGGTGGTNLFVGLLEGTVQSSTNNGASWTGSTPSRYMVRALAVSPVTGGTGGANLFAGTDGGGVYLSTNNGASWTATNTGLADNAVYSLVVSGGNLFAGTYTGGVFLSTNNGTNWTAVNSGLTNKWVYSLAVSGSSLFAGTYNGGIFLSTNNGASWIAVNTGLTNNYVLALTVIPAAGGTGGANIFAGTAGGVFLSTNSGTSWTAVNTGLTNSVVYSLAASGTNLFAGTWGGVGGYGGVFISTNSGLSWTAVSTGLTATYVYSLAVNGTYLFAGTALDGVGGSVWRRPLSELTSPVSSTVAVTSPNGGENWQVGSSHNITWTSSNVSNVMIEYSTNNGSSWNGIVTSYPASGGSYSWTVPNAPSTQCKVRVSDAASPTSVTDQSDIVFTISAASGGTGLIAYYPFNGNANDESGNGRNGVNYGATLTTDRFGQASKAYSFNGISNFIDIPGTSTLHLASGFTLCAWVNFTDASSYHAIVGKHVAGYGDGYYLMIRPETKPEFFTSSEPGLQSPDAINDGKWHFLVGTYDGSTMRLYVDNVLKLTQPKTYSSTNDSTLSIGKHHAIPNWFSGKIDDVSIYGRALTATEISTLFGASSASVTVTSPNGGENWQVGSSHNITWASSGVSNVMVEYSTNNGSSWNGIVTSYPASGGSYSWTVPNASSTQCKVRVSDAANSTAVQDVSDNSFTISSGGSGMGWIAVNTGLTRTNIYALALSPASGGTSTNLFAATENGGIFLSTDNGTSWTAANSGIKSTAVVNSFAFIGTNIFAGSSSGVYLSTNNGTSWTPANTGLTDTNVWSLAASGTNLYAGTSSSLFLSTNNGTSWTAISARLTNSGIYALAMSGSSSFAGAYEGVFRSTDNGTTWIAANNGLDNKTIRAFVFSGTSIFVGTYGGGVCLSTNNGTSWNYASSGITDFTIWALAMTGTNLFASTYYAGVFLSPNNGTSWTAVNAGLTNLNVHNLALSPAAGGAGSAYLFAGTLGAGVWRRPLSEMITSAERLLTDLPTHFSLSQNYPNPFNPSTVISFDVPARSYVSLKIFDMIGREVSSLVSEELSMGKYSRRWNAEGLPSGVYCYRLQARPISGGQIGSVTETKKLILLR